MDSPMEPYRDSMLAASTILVKKKKDPGKEPPTPKEILSRAMAEFAEKRWENVSKRKRMEHGKMMAEARWGKTPEEKRRKKKRGTIRVVKEE